MTPSLTPRGVAALDEWMTHCVEEGLVPGLVTLVTTPDRVVYHEAAGLADVARRRAMPRDAIVRIASMTKPLTSAAFMTLVETGRVGLDDEVARYLPRHGGRRVLTRVDQAGGTFDTAPCSHPMTVRHVLTHTSGIGATWSDHGLALVERSTPGLDEDDLPLVHEPGARWTYGTGTKVLGDIAEVVTGLPIEAFLARTILEPVGMTETGFEVPEPLHRRVATLHQRIDDRRCETPNAAVLAHDRRGDGRLFSTADDYGRFLRMILNEGRVGSVRVLAPATVREMTRNHIAPLTVREQPCANPMRTCPFPPGAGRDGWGLGFQVTTSAPTRRGQRGSGSLWWAGINNTFFWIDPAARLGVVVLMQLLPFCDAAALRVLDGVERRIYDTLAA